VDSQSRLMEQPATKKSAKWNVRPVHRIIGSIILLFTLYLSVTGSVMQIVDLRALLTHAPATDKEMIQIREGLNGPGNYVVIQPTDYEASPLPANFDLSSALATVLHAARTAKGEAVPFRFIDLRVADGKPIGIVRAGDQNLFVDAATGAVLPNPPRAAAPEKSIHLTFKVLHVLRGTSNWITLIHIVVGTGLFIATIMGLVLYFQMLRARRRANLKGFFWSSGGIWRSIHRSIAVLAAVFLLVISFTGTMLAIDALGLGIYRATHKDAGKYASFPKGSIADFSSPLPDTRLPAMLQTTLAAGRGISDASPIKAVRLRYFNGIPQGILIAGNGDDTQQLVFNAETGKSMNVTEPEYPKTHYHLGWQEHELVKKIHRGDAFGIPGRIMHLFAGLSLIYLSISGLVMYVNLWRARRRSGRTALFWV
jgi:uncharacterized iron-regulated membrane protein